MAFVCPQFKYQTVGQAGPGNGGNKGILHIPQLSSIIGNGGNKGILHIPQLSSIIGASPSDCLVSYQGRSLRVGALTLL